VFVQGVGAFDNVLTELTHTSEKPMKLTFLLQNIEHYGKKTLDKLTFVAIQEPEIVFTYCRSDFHWELTQNSSNLTDEEMDLIVEAFAYLDKYISLDEFTNADKPFEVDIYTTLAEQEANCMQGYDENLKEDDGSNDNIWELSA